tara:strand:- start:6157 stop:6906 length:750 start_codon:yes stop_codon:yes gene_type:complete
MTNKKINISAIIEARMSSTRLPGKVLKNIGNKTCLEHLIHRLQKVEELNNIIVATSTNKKDNAIERLCKKNNFSYSRGSEDNVLNRVLNSAKQFDVDIIVEITGDSIFIDHEIISEAIQLFLTNKYDFVANCVKEPTYIPGFDARVLKTELLENIEKLIKDEEDYEHVTSYIWKNPSKFKIKNIHPPKFLDRRDIFLGLDTEEDLKLLRKIYKNLGSKNEYFNAYEIVNFLTLNTDIKKINEEIKRNIV